MNIPDMIPFEPNPFGWAERACLYVGEKVFTRPRLEWPPGPWEDEPDMIAWTHGPSGYPLLMMRNQMGAWCGYVGLPPSHTLHSLPYQELEDLAGDVEAHRGVTYSGHMRSELSAPETWWVGFDCAHAFDMMPALEALMATQKLDWPDLASWKSMNEYKDVAYVRASVEAMAARAWELGQVRFPGDK